MRVVSIAARAFRWSMTSRGAARGRGERASVVLEVRSERGAVGLGEAAPLPGMSTDTLDDAAHALAAFARLAPFDVVDREAAGARAAALPPAARFAVETALLDALGRERGVPLSAVLRPDATLRALPLAAVVDDADDARRAVAAGIRCLKIKLAADDDPGRAFAIAAAAPGARLRIDANRSWPRGEVARRLAALAAGRSPAGGERARPLLLDYVEEPCADAASLAYAPLDCKIALDESLATLARDELLAALRGPTLGALVLKPTVLGGIAATIELAGLARAAGVAAIISHALEGPIGTAACAELALALGGEVPVGLAAHAALDGWALSVPQLAPDRVAPAGPGLAFADLDLARLARAAGAGSPP